MFKRVRNIRWSRNVQTNVGIGIGFLIYNLKSLGNSWIGLKNNITVTVDNQNYHYIILIILVLDSVIGILLTRNIVSVGIGIMIFFKIRRILENLWLGFSIVILIDDPGQKIIFYILVIRLSKFNIDYFLLFGLGLEISIKMRVIRKCSYSLQGLISFMF